MSSVRYGFHLSFAVVCPRILLATICTTYKSPKGALDSYPRLAHELLHRHQGTVSNIKVFVSHEFHYARLATKVCNQSEDRVNSS